MSKVSINTKDIRFPVAPDLYGLFFEDINRAGDGGLYPEMLRNRSFEDSIPPERCTLSENNASFTTPQGWSDQFNNGEGLAGWFANTPPTAIPAWYADNAAMTLDHQDTLNPRRLASLRVEFSAGGCIKNIGYNGIPLKKGEKYTFYMFAKTKGAGANLKVSIASAAGDIQDEAVITVEPGEYKRYTCAFTAAHDDFDARLVITSPNAAAVNFGFTSLMPADTYKGHGMRKDLMEMLERTNSKFMRFPGGCIVEGFTRETAMRFSNTIGPVWERPSLVLMWHYRTTNGFGFHEFLQACEDLGLEPMYVINCGLTCQGRSPEVFTGDEIGEFLKEALDAIEYALGDSSTPMGRKRAEAGHPEPFKLKYIEIGNENSGPEYNERYLQFYTALKARYPKIKYISTSHTEHDGLPTEIADEHFYHTPEFFAENSHLYDTYNRHGPDIFVGEYSVNSDVQPGTLRCAIGEAMFLAGVENNQDIVTTTAYAPLFENVGFSGWKPDLIAFDNHRAYGIPSYHMISMMASNRGREVIGSTVATEQYNRTVSGLPGIRAEKGGLRFRNATLDGKPAAVSHVVQGKFSKNGDEQTAASDPAAKNMYFSPNRDVLGEIVWAVLGDNPSKIHTYEIEAQSSKDNPVTIAVWCHRPLSYFNIDETAGETWNMHSVRGYYWKLDGSTGKVSAGNTWHQEKLGEDIALPADLGEYNTYKIVTREDGFDCYLNGKLVQKAFVPTHPRLGATAAIEGATVIVKIVNMKDEPDDAEIALDCAVSPEYEAQLLTADDPDAVNSFDAPLAVSPSSKTLDGAAQNFVYQAPAYSLSILKLAKLQR